MDPDNIQRRPREGTNVDIQRQIVTDRKSFHKLNTDKTVTNNTNEDKILMGSVLESDKTVYEKQQSSINVETATVEYL
jgi:hypothetical protein